MKNNSVQDARVKFQENIDVLMDLAHECYQMAVTAQGLNILRPDPEMARAAKKWYRCGKRAEEKAKALELKEMRIRCLEEKEGNFDVNEH